MVQYEIEHIRKDHPAILTGSFEACAIALFRSASASSPWRLAIDCRQLPKVGTKQENCELSWQQASESNADKAEKTYQDKRLTEDAAIGVCAAAFAGLQEGVIDEATAYGTGVDYWIDNRRAVLEISGIATGSRGGLTSRHQAKIKQMKQGLPFAGGKPGYVFVVAFGTKKAIFSYHT